MDELDELLKLVSWLNSCDARGHYWVRFGAGAGTSEDTTFWGLTQCSRCGVVLEEPTDG